MSPIIAILWWLSLGAVAIGAFILGYRIGASRDSCDEPPQTRSEATKS